MKRVALQSSLMRHDLLVVVNAIEHRSKLRTRTGLEMPAAAPTLAECPSPAARTELFGKT
jgi:hypothetical protein